MNNSKAPLLIETIEGLKEVGNSLEMHPNGIVMVVDKPYSWSSGDVVRKVKIILQRRFSNRRIKVGHAGTLDPLATGVLLLCIGRATKLSNLLTAEDKEYLATITFGATTPSFDLGKEIDHHYHTDHLSRQFIEQLIPSFIGEQEQIPPLYSAKLVDGVRAYHLAREGDKRVLKPSTITIHSMEIESWDSPNLTLNISCSKGTYIRSIARDLGVSAQSGAYLSSLIRTSSGNYRVEKSITIEQLTQFEEENWR